MRRDRRRGKARFADARRAQVDPAAVRTTRRSVVLRLALGDGRRAIVTPVTRALSFSWTRAMNPDLPRFYHDDVAGDVVRVEE